MGEIHPTTGDLVSVIFSGDPAVDLDKSDFTSYILSGDEKHVALTGEPTRYLFTPLRRRERDWVFGEEGTGFNPAVRGYSTFAVSLHSIEGPAGTLLDESAVRRLKRRVGGVLCIPAEAGLWDDESLLPDGCVTEVGCTAFNAAFRQ